MPLFYQQAVDSETKLAIWKIEESPEELYAQLQLRDHEKIGHTTALNHIVRALGFSGGFGGFVLGSVLLLVDSGIEVGVAGPRVPHAQRVDSDASHADATWRFVRMKPSGLTTNPDPL